MRACLRISQALSSGQLAHVRKIEEYTGKEFAYLADLKGACLSDDEVELLRKYREASETAREIARFALSTKAD
jgi:hypothetical protein